MRRVVYFATAAPREAAEDLQRLRLCESGCSLRVVARSDTASRLQQLTGLAADRFIIYTPFLAPLIWLGLCNFLGFSARAEIVCFKSPGCRSLKFLAFLLPGRLTFSEGKAPDLPCSRFQLLRGSVAQAIGPKGPICVMASASPMQLGKIVADVRRRFPAARLHGMVAAALDEDGRALFDSEERIKPPLQYLRLLAQCVGRRRFQRVIVPCTGENHGGLKWLGWWLPLWHVEFYNEHLDAFSARNPYSLVSHWWWRARQRREARRRLLPVAVLGSASGFYLEKIVPAVRARFPQARLCGILPKTLDAPARGLFDSTTILPDGFLRSLWETFKISRRPFQAWIVPCTNEHYARMKALAFLPLGPRHVYNELADGFLAGNVRMFYRHIAWRLRDHLSFQILAGTAGDNLLFRAVHLCVYGLRLLLGAVLLLRVRLRSAVRRRLHPAAESSGLPVTGPAVDLIYLETDAAAPNDLMPSEFRSRPGFARAAVSVHRLGDGGVAAAEINMLIRDSRADFVCLMDARCKMRDEEWLGQLLQAFDENTAQVGPQILMAADGGFVRGGILGGRNVPTWNSDNAVCWHRRPDWLAVDALPWVCLVIRRKAFLQAGGFSEACGREPLWVDLEFCRRLAARGWRSLCNQSVTAEYCLAVMANELEPAVGAVPALGKAEDLG